MYSSYPFITRKFLMKCSEKNKKHLLKVPTLDCYLAISKDFALSSVWHSHDICEQATAHTYRTCLSTPPGPRAGGTRCLDPSLGAATDDTFNKTSNLYTREKKLVTILLDWPQRKGRAKVGGGQGGSKEFGLPRLSNHCFSCPPSLEK